MLSPDILARESLKRRKAAPYHFQVEVDQQHVRQALGPNPTALSWRKLPIQGRVVRLFRFGWRFGVGDMAKFLIPVLDPDEGFFHGPSGISGKDLLRATHLEVYLTKKRRPYELIAYEYKILENGPTTKPVMSVKEVEQRLAAWKNRSALPKRKWWEFSKNRASDAQEVARKAGRTLGLDPRQRSSTRPASAPKQNHGAEATPASAEQLASDRAKRSRRARKFSVS